MMTAGPELHIRPPLWARGAIALFGAVWVVLWLTVLRDQRIGWVLGPAGLLITYRTTTMGVVGTPDGRLVVRNQLWTRTFRRQELADAVVDRGSRLGLPFSGWTVWIVLQNGGRHPVQLTEVPFRTGSRERLERQATEIRRWIAADSRPAAYRSG